MHFGCLYLTRLIHYLLSYQEDFYTFSALSLDPEELSLSLKKSHNVDWDHSDVPESLARQVLFVGIYDGHGGSTVSQYLRQELHGLFESADKAHVPELLAWAKELGGYFRRFRGGALSAWAKPSSPDAQRKLDLEARATLAFFEVSTVFSSHIAKFTFTSAYLGLLTYVSLDRSSARNRAGCERMWCDRIGCVIAFHR